MDDNKELLHNKSWDLYVDEKEQLVNGKYLVGFDSHYKKKVLWKVVDDHVVEEPSDNKYI